MHQYLLTLNRLCLRHVANTCTCSNGTPTVATGTDGTICDTNNQEDCSACGAGYTITDTAASGSAQTCTGKCDSIPPPRPSFMSLVGYNTCGLLFCIAIDCTTAFDRLHDDL